MQGPGEIGTVLKNGGLAALSIRSKEKMGKYAVTQYGFRPFSPFEVADMLQQSWFREVRIDLRDQDKSYDQVIVVGTR